MHGAGNCTVIDSGSGVPIKAWTKGVPFEDDARRQISNVARLPFIHKWVAVMPDVHMGKGAAIGTVIPSLGAIIPAAVGVDIGCGMMAVKTSLSANDLPDNLAGVRGAIEAAVPHGRSHHGGTGDCGAWGEIPQPVASAWQDLQGEFAEIAEKHPKVAKTNHVHHLGTLGTGNHFIEVCLDNYVAREHHFNKDVWVTRKGAVRARAGEFGIIPGSMGAASYIVRGKGNRDSLCSCSHGAGRIMSRGEARRRFSLDDHVRAMMDVECRKDREVIDETPAAYKPIAAVMKAQEDLVDIVHTLRQVVCVKG